MNQNGRWLNYRETTLHPELDLWPILLCGTLVERPVFLLHRRTKASADVENTTLRALATKKSNLQFGLATVIRAFWSGSSAKHLLPRSTVGTKLPPVKTLLNAEAQLAKG